MEKLAPNYCVIRMDEEHPPCREEGNIMKIRNHSALVQALGCDSIDHATRRLYKDTQCGAWVDWSDNGSVCVGSIVEGSNVEPTVSPRRLHYPFDYAVFEAAIEDLERDVAVCRGHINECDDDCDGGACGYLDHCGALEIEMGHVRPRRGSKRTYRVSLAKSIVGWRVVSVRDERSHKTLPLTDACLGSIATWLGATQRGHAGLVVAFGSSEGQVLERLWSGCSSEYRAARRGPRLFLTTDPV